MKLLSKITLFSLLMGMLFTACEKDNVDQITPNNPNFTPDTVGVNPFLKQMKTFSGDTVYISCLAIPFPIDLKQRSGSTLTVNSESDLMAASVNPDSIVDFVYPFQAYTQGNSFTINNIGELVTNLVFCDTSSASCADYDAHVLLFFPALNIFTSNKYEYTINYPVTLIVEGQTVVLNDDDDYLPAIGGSPSNYLETELVYPISVIQFGQTITLNNNQDVCDFNQLLSEDCVNKPAHIQFFFNEGGGVPSTCAYFINYPVNVDLNGNQISIQSASAYRALLNTNPNAYANLTLKYPVSATRFQNGQSLTFTTDADICQYLDNCN